MAEMWTLLSFKVLLYVRKSPKNATSQGAVTAEAKGAEAKAKRLWMQARNANGHTMLDFPTCASRCSNSVALWIGRKMMAFLLRLCNYPVTIVQLSCYDYVIILVWRV